jgi:hypothetical protein
MYEPDYRRSRPLEEMNAPTRRLIVADSPSGRSQRARRRLFAGEVDFPDRWAHKALPTHDARGRPYPPISPTDLPADIVLARLHGITGSGPTWYVHCPAHCDDHPSLSVTETDDAILLIHCHAGCAPEEIVSAIGLDMSFLFPTAYALEHGRGKERTGIRRSRWDPDDPRAEPVIDYARFERLAEAARATDRQVAELAQKLGLPCASLRALGVGYDDGKGCWVFPERDSERRVVGLIYRSADGEKICAKESKRGLTIPRDIDQFDDGPIYLPEGASDTAALHSVGALAIGRPAADASALVRRWLPPLLSGYGDRPIIVVADRDNQKNGKQPGAAGASVLALWLRAALLRPVSWALPAPPHKDVRDQIVAGDWHKGLSNDSNA